MQWISKGNILIVGLGLMGGSYARALSRLGYSVTAIDSRRESIDYALSNGLIREGSDTVSAELAERADAVIFGLYPKRLVEWLRANQGLFRPGTMMTDVTGVKTAVVYEIQELLRDDLEFIAAHPMAGREMSGVENSDDRIFHGANYIVVPTKKTRRRPSRGVRIWGGYWDSERSPSCPRRNMTG